MSTPIRGVILAPASQGPVGLQASFLSLTLNGADDYASPVILRMGQYSGAKITVGTPTPDVPTQLKFGFYPATGLSTIPDGTIFDLYFDFDYLGASANFLINANSFSFTYNGSTQQASIFGDMSSGPMPWGSGLNEAMIRFVKIGSGTGSLSRLSGTLMALN